MRSLKIRWFSALDSKTQGILRTSAFASADYVVNVLILFAFAAIGVISYRIPFQILGIVVAFYAIFLASAAFGIPQRFRDSSIIGLQALLACSVNLLGLILAPQIAYIFIVNLFVPLSFFSSLYFTQRMFLILWVLLACAFGGAMLLVNISVDIAFATPVERLLFWLVTMLALGRFLAINADISRLRLRLENKNTALHSATAKLSDLASRDELTGLWNRREFMRLLQDESRRAVRNRSSFCIAIIDLDRFKQINDRFGHLIGDAVLHEIGQLLESMRRATDSAARYGGEEFTLLLTNTKLSTATVALERIRYDIAEFDWESVAKEMALTISAGIAAWQPGETINQVMNRAEAALWEAKNAGRNCVKIASA